MRFSSRIEISTRLTELKEIENKLQLYEKNQPVLKCNSLKKRKFRRLMK